MTGNIDVAVLIGSLRTNSFSSRVAAALRERAPARLRFRTVPIGELPLYNQDLDGDAAPAAYGPFRTAIAQAQAVLFVTPEYNRSVPGCLKNAIDVASRPQGQGALLGKPAAVISQSPGAMGGFGANHAIRQSLVFLNMPVLQQPEAYIGQVGNAFDEAGALKSDTVAKLLTDFAAAFERWIDRTA